MPGTTQSLGVLASIPARLRRPVATGAYRPEIDGLRFLAIAIVVVGHFLERSERFFPERLAALGPLGDYLPKAGLGVYLFFTISGYILTVQALKAKVSPLSATFLKSYFGRRVLRIEPPYVILLVATFAALSLSGYRPEMTSHFDVVPRSLVASLFGSIVYLHDLTWGSYPRLFPPGWSLEVEVQFYVVAPLLFWLYAKTPGVAARTILGVAVLGLASLVSLMVPERIGPLHAHFSILNFFRFFWLGLLLADLQPWLVRKLAGWPPLAIGLLGWGGLAAFLELPLPADADLLPAMAARGAVLVSLVAIFASAFSARSSLRAFCARPWVSLVGGACYSIYLTHQQVIQAMTTVIAKVAPGIGIGRLALVMAVEVLACLVVGLASYAVIERTFMIKDWPRIAWSHAAGWFGRGRSSASAKLTPR